MSLRTQKLNSLIALHLAEIFVKDLEMPRNTFPSIVKVDTSADLEQSKVFVTVVPKAGRERALHYLENNAARVRTILSKKLVTYKCPRLIFILDTTLDRAERIDQLISIVHDEQNSSPDIPSSGEKLDDSVSHQA